jgi:hypothetical protein
MYAGNSVRAIIGGGQGWLGGVMADQHVLHVQQSWWNVGEAVEACLLRAGGGAEASTNERSCCRKFSAGSGFAAVTNWPGRTNCAPYSSSAGEGVESSLVAAQAANKVQGRWWYESAEARRARRVLEAAVKLLNGTVGLRMVGGGL